MDARDRRLIALSVLVFIIALAALLFLGLDLPREFDRSGLVPKVLFLLVIIVEVIVAPIPGGVISFLGAALLGFWTAWPIMYAGNIIGGISVFLLSRHLGRDIVEKHVDTAQLERYNTWLRAHPKTTWVLYAIPVFPIDTISIVLGLSAMKLRRYVVMIVSAVWLYTGITAILGSKASDYIPHLEALTLAVFIAFLAALSYFGWTLRKKS